ncbi:glycosyltransferase family 4 protein [Aestuariibius sp. 2305UL40-4]|uniref:glycosyltransferase family 4 protein n=1 Tax=Aestuariibius violaceus TaxID=3234132 RepID=UPI00345F0888
MTRPRIAFAVPGKITTLTGGTIYDRRVIEKLPALGCDVQHIELPNSFPAPPPDDMDHALAQLSDVPPDVPLIVDGLAFGALDPRRVSGIQSPLVPLVHHPLAEESGLTEGRRKHLFETERANLSHAHHVLVPSPHTAELLTRKYDVQRKNITIARPGTDRPRLAAAPIDPPLILAVGIQLPRKGHDVLIRALSQIKALEWQAVIAGAPLDPAFSDELRALRSDTGLDERLKLAGRIERDELERLYAKASIFALATRYEGYGIVFDEALSHGLPIVSCAAGAVPDTVPHEAGLLVPPDAPDAFADALRTMLTDLSFRQGCAAAARIAGDALPGWDDTAKAIADALEEILVIQVS